MKKLFIIILFCVLLFSPALHSQNTGKFGGPTFGAFGKHVASDNYGYLGSSYYGIKGVQDPNETGPGVFGICGPGLDVVTNTNCGVFGRELYTANYGYLGSSNYGVFGENVEYSTHGYFGSVSFGALGKHGVSENYGYLGSSHYGVKGVQDHEGTGPGVYGMCGPGQDLVINTTCGIYGKDLDSENYGYLGSADYGVYGRADESGQSAIYGFSTSGWAGYFNGRVRIFAGQLSINTDLNDYALQIENNANNIYGRGRAREWTTYSDRRIKSNIRKIDYGLETILKLQPRAFFQHNSKFDKESETIIIESQGAETIGFIAQDLYKIVPEASCPPKDDTKSLWGVCLTNLIPVIVKAIQEQNETIENQKTDNETQQNEIAHLRREIETQKTENKTQQSEIEQLRHEIELIKKEICLIIVK